MRKALYLVGELTDQDLDWLVESGQRRAIARNVSLITQDEPVSQVYIILRGVYAVRDEKLDRELARIGSGEVVGEMSFVQAQLPAATVTALEDGVVLALPRRKLWEKLMSDAGFSSRFYRALAMFLADRLRGTVRTLGYGAPVPGVDDATLAENSSDPAVAARVRAVQERFEAVLRRLGA